MDIKKDRKTCTIVTSLCSAPGGGAHVVDTCHNGTRNIRRNRANSAVRRRRIGRHSLLRYRSTAATTQTAVFIYRRDKQLPRHQHQQSSSNWEERRGKERTHHHPPYAQKNTQQQAQRELRVIDGDFRKSVARFFWPWINFVDLIGPNLAAVRNWRMEHKWWVININVQ